jgi:hypothetical protein
MVISDTDPKLLVNRLLEYEPPAVDKWIDRRQT